MNEGASVRNLLDLIFSEHFKNTTDVTVPDLLIPDSLFTNDLSAKVRLIVGMKERIFSPQWQIYIVECGESMFSSHHEYLRNVIFPCLAEHKCYENIFESFINVCAFLKFFNERILNNTGINFRELNTDVFMVLYDNVMKESFCQHGGFGGLVEYISAHRYLTWKWDWKNPISMDPSTSVIIQADIGEKVNKEMKSRYNTAVKTTRAETRDTSIVLARKVLLTTSVKLPLLPNIPSINCLVASGNERTAGKTEKERIMKAAAGFVDLDSSGQECSTSYSDSKTNCALSNNSDSIENIIQAVIRRNCSKSSDTTKSDNQISKDVDKALEILKEGFESLLIVLNEYDKE